MDKFFLLKNFVHFLDPESIRIIIIIFHILQIREHSIADDYSYFSDGILRSK